MFLYNRMIRSEQQYKHQFQLLQDAKTKENIQTKEQLDTTNKQIQDLKAQLQSKRDKAVSDALLAASSIVAMPAHASVPTASVQPTSDAKLFIYTRESGNNPGAVNRTSGACGLGQALPCSKMPCSLSDYACQDNFFTQYMLKRYGSWEAARAFWLLGSWW